MSLTQHFQNLSFFRTNLPIWILSHGSTFWWKNLLCQSWLCSFCLNQYLSKTKWRSSSKALDASNTLRSWLVQESFRVNKIIFSFEKWLEYFYTNWYKSYDNKNGGMINKINGKKWFLNYYKLASLVKLDFILEKLSCLQNCALLFRNACFYNFKIIYLPCL